MTWFRGLLLRVRGIVRPHQSDRDLRDQIEAHLEEATEEYIRQGQSRAEARRAARLDVGSVVQAEETYRDVRGRWLQDLTKDFRYGLRSLRRNPGFAAVAVLSLAVGIGANTAIFSIVNSILLRPRAVADPQQLVELYTGEREHPYETTSYPSYLDFRDRNGVFSGLAAYAIRQFKMTDPNHVEQVWGEVVSANYFDVLGVRPHAGRLLAAADDVEPADHAVVVVGYEFWRRRFNADPNVIGQPISINNQNVTIVGIAPPQYTGMMRGLAIQVWIPASAMPLVEPLKGRSLLTSRGSRWLVLVGRLAPGTTVERARTRFDLLSREMQLQHPEEWRSVLPESGRVRELFASVLRERDTRVPPSMLLGAYAVVGLLVAIVNVVLLIACMNLAGCCSLERSSVARKWRSGWRWAPAVGG
jgi:putative ABC transport system permease protein